MVSQRGQGTVEYIGLIAVAAVLLAGLATAIGWWAPGGELARAVVGKIICAVRSSDSCSVPPSDSEALAAYGPEVAELVDRHAPGILFEDEDVVSLPVDFRDCKELTCADAVGTRAVSRSHAGQLPTAFTHVIDCRGGADRHDYECSGAREGSLYLQYWLYYPDSATEPLGRFGYHQDDWESYQVRVTADGATLARASSHNGHNSDGNLISRTINDNGGVDVDPRPGREGVSSSSGWGPATGSLWVSAGSHAGRTVERPHGALRRIPSRQLHLVPLELLNESERTTDFEVPPPWEKRLWRDPEERGTG